MIKKVFVNSVHVKETEREREKRVCDFFDDRQESKKGNCLRKGLGSASTIAQACTKVLKRNLKKKISVFKDILHCNQKWNLNVKKTKDIEFVLKVDRLRFRQASAE